MIKPVIKINTEFMYPFVCAQNLVIKDRMLQRLWISAAIEYFPTDASGTPPSPLTQFTTMHLSESSVSLENNQIHTQREVERRGREKRGQCCGHWPLRLRVGLWKGPRLRAVSQGPLIKQEAELKAPEGVSQTHSKTHTYRETCNKASIFTPATS